MTPASGKRRKDSHPDEFIIPKFVRHSWTDSQLAQFHATAKRYAEKNRSDPFAFGRMFLHLQRGIAVWSEVLSDIGPPSLS